jgi:hypothetical protein
MAIQSSMGAHKLDVRYGNWSSLPFYNGILSYAYISDAAVVALGAGNCITAGKVYSLTTGGLLTPGILATAGANGGTMPLFGLSGLDANNYPDVQRDRGMPSFGNKPNPAPGGNGGTGFPFHGVPLSTGPVGSFATIRHNMAGELSTTEFDTAAAYVVGEPLTAVAATAPGAATVLSGKLRPLNAATDTIVGYVAPAGKFTGPEGYSVLAFIPAFVQGTTVAADFT